MQKVTPEHALTTPANTESAILAARMLGDVGDRPVERDEMAEEQRRQAIGRIRAKRGFWRHLAIYIVVNAVLVAIWYYASDGYFWPMWPALGWGIGLIVHGFTVFVRASPITEEQIRREIDRGRRP